MINLLKKRTVSLLGYENFKITSDDIFLAQNYGYFSELLSTSFRGMSYFRINKLFISGFILLFYYHTVFLSQSYVHGTLSSQLSLLTLATV